MGERKRSTAYFLKDTPPCIFCGGVRPATTKEHCPPRALFDGKQWPEGFEFPACETCNGGTSDADLVVSLLSFMNTGEPATPDRSRQVLGLARQVGRQRPEVRRGLAFTSATEARHAARRLGTRPAPGQTYTDLPIFRVPPEVPLAVQAFADKLTRATFCMRAGRAFPADGGIVFHWFTNAASRGPSGMPWALEGLSDFAMEPLRLVRSGHDLSNQLELASSVVDDAEGLFLLAATFRQSFGFVCIAYTQREQAMHVLAQAREASSESDERFTLLPRPRAAEANR